MQAPPHAQSMMASGGAPHATGGGNTWAGLGGGFRLGLGNGAIYSSPFSGGIQPSTMGSGLASISSTRHPQHSSPGGSSSAGNAQGSNAPVGQPPSGRRVYMSNAHVNMPQQSNVNMMNGSGMPMPPAIGSQFKPAPGGSVQGTSSNIWSNFGGQVAPAGSAFTAQPTQRSQQPTQLLQQQQQQQQSRGHLGQRHPTARHSGHQPRIGVSHLLQPSQQQDQQRHKQQQGGHVSRHRGHGQPQHSGAHDSTDSGGNNMKGQGRRHNNNSGRGRGRGGGSRGRGHGRRSGDKGGKPHSKDRQSRFKTRRNPSSNKPQTGAHSKGQTRQSGPGQSKASKGKARPQQRKTQTKVVFKSKVPV